MVKQNNFEQSSNDVRLLILVGSIFFSFLYTYVFYSIIFLSKVDVQLNVILSFQYFKKYLDLAWFSWKEFSSLSNLGYFLGFSLVASTVVSFIKNKTVVKGWFIVINLTFLLIFIFPEFFNQKLCFILGNLQLKNFIKYVIYLMFIHNALVVFKIVELLLEKYKIKDYLDHEFDDIEINKKKIKRFRLKKRGLPWKRVCLGNEIKKNQEIVQYHKWMNKKDLFYLGISLRSGAPIYADKRNWNKPSHGIGSTRSGKSALLERQINDAMVKGEPIILCDFKGDPDFIKRVFKMCVDNGRDRDFKLFSMAHPEASVSWNPSFKGDHTAILDRLTSLIDWESAFYKTEALKFTVNIIRTLKLTKKAFSAKDIVELILDKEYYKKVIDSIEDGAEKDSILAGYLKTNFKDENFTRIADEVNLILSTSYGQLLCETNPGLDLLHDTQVNPCIIMFSIDANQYPDNAKYFGRMLLVAMQYISSELQEIGKKKRKDINFYIDEADVVNVKELAAGINKWASKGIRFKLDHQELSQFDDELQECIINNTKNNFQFKQKSEASVKSISSGYGTVRRIKYTNKVENNDFGKTKVLNEGSSAVNDVFISHPNQIKRLVTGECFYNAEYSYVNVHDKIALDFILFKEISLDTFSFIQLCLKYMYLSNCEELDTILSKNKKSIKLGAFDKVIEDLKNVEKGQSLAELFEVNPDKYFYKMLEIKFRNSGFINYGEPIKRSFYFPVKEKPAKKNKDEQLDFEDIVGGEVKKVKPVFSDSEIVEMLDEVG